MERQPKFRVSISGKGHNKSVEIDTDGCVLGRGKECDIVLDDDLISRKHIKISLKNNEIQIEELGSTNGTWIDSVKMEKGKKITYSSELKVTLGGASGITLAIENLVIKQNLLSIQKTVVKTVADKTLIHNIATLKVGNGSVEPVSYAVSAPAIPAETRNIKLVSDDVTLKDISKKSINFSDKKTGTKTSLDNKLKQIVTQESDRLREKAIREAKQLKQKALDEEKNIKDKARKEALEIIEQSKIEAAAVKAEAESSILMLKEKIKHTELESEMAVKNMKLSIVQFEERIASLRQVEAGHNQKMKQLEDEYAGTRERIRNENLLLEELKHQSNTVKKNADLKLEEVALQERRSRAKIESEISEARNQTAKIFAEAEKAQALKDSMGPEIQQLKNEKIKIEKEINDSIAKQNKLDSDYAKASNALQVLVSETSNSRNELEEIHTLIRSQNDKVNQLNEQYNEKERSLKQKIEQLEQSAVKIIETAEFEASKIISEAMIKTQNIAEQNTQVLKDQEAQKLKFHESFEIEKKNKHKDLQHEIELKKAGYSQELEKLEAKKNALTNEMKWMESNAKATSEKMVTDAKTTCEKMAADAKAEVQELKDQTIKNVELLKATAKTEAQNLKERTHKEVLSAKENANIEIQNLKKEASAEINNMKMAFNAESARLKNLSLEEVAKQKNEIERELGRVQAELATTTELKKTLQDSIERADKMMNENHLQAAEKVRSMIADAEKQALAIEQEGINQKAKELAGLLDIRKAEAEKIEEMKEKFEEYKLNSKREMAETIGIAVQEFLTIEMIKSRNLILDEKLIKKISDKSKRIVTDASLGRLQASTKNINELFKIKRTDYVGILKIIVTLVIVVGTLYLAKTYPQQTHELISSITAFLKEQNITF